MFFAHAEKQEALEEPISLTWNPMQLNDSHFSMKSDKDDNYATWQPF